MLKISKRTFLWQTTGLLTLSLFSGFNRVMAGRQKELFSQPSADNLISSLTNNAELTVSNAIHKWSSRTHYCQCIDKKCEQNIDSGR
jgi:hypothetical protein